MSPIFCVLVSLTGVGDGSVDVVGCLFDVFSVLFFVIWKTSKKNRIIILDTKITSEPST